MEVKVVALHGFLGTPADWDFLRARFDVIAPGLFERPGVAGLESWGHDFAKALPGGRHVLVGYSLGGRLALHALLAAPEKFQAAILIGAHPGLSTETERAERRASDARWAERFLREPWSDVVGAWEAQPVFRGTFGSPRREESYSREALSHALLAWSLGAQADLRPRLQEISQPMHWLAGARDAKFSRLAEEAAALSHYGQAHIVDNAGHRVPWDRPDLVLELLETLKGEKQWKNGAC